MIIRLATIKDLKSVQAHSLALFVKEQQEYDSTLDCSWTHSKKGLAYFRKRILAKQVWVAEEKKEIIGYLCAGLGSESDAYRTVKPTAELENIFVVPTKRSNGVGRRLVKAFLSWAKMKKAQTIFVKVTAPNLRAMVFYESLGFKPYYVALEINAKNTFAK